MCTTCFFLPFHYYRKSKVLDLKATYKCWNKCFARTRILMTKGDHVLFQLCSVVVKKKNNDRAVN